MGKADEVVRPQKNMAITAWEGNWSRDLTAALAALGFSDLVQYSDSKPSLTYHQLAEELGKAAARTFAPVQIEHALRDAAVEQNRVALFARISLVRHLRHLMPNGWSKTDVFQFSHAIGAWGSRLPKKFQKRCGDVGKSFLVLNVPERWLPMDHRDEILVRAFEEAGFS
jgi:hypothetical protein